MPLLAELRFAEVVLLACRSPSGLPTIVVVEVPTLLLPAGAIVPLLAELRFVLLACQFYIRVADHCCCVCCGHVIRSSGMIG